MPTTTRLTTGIINKIDHQPGLFIASGTQVSVREVSASVTSGAFWFSVIFAEGGK